MAHGPQRRMKMVDVGVPGRGRRPWLREHGVTQVVMEATGVYWKPVWNLLEGQFGLLLVNPQHVKALAGKKTDRQDGERRADWLQHGLLQGSFVPSPEMVANPGVHGGEDSQIRGGDPETDRSFRGGGEGVDAIAGSAGNDGLVAVGRDGAGHEPVRLGRAGCLLGLRLSWQ